MTRDDILRMAREAGFVLSSNATGEAMGRFERFADLVAAAEREACAQVCESRAGTVSMFATMREARAHNSAVGECAAVIRARGRT